MHLEVVQNVSDLFYFKVYSATYSVVLKEQTFVFKEDMQSIREMAYHWPKLFVALDMEGLV